MQVSDIIDRFGSAAEFARAVGLKRPQHGVSMRRRNSIPAQYWPIIIRVSAERGFPVSLDELRTANPGASELVPVASLVGQGAPHSSKAVAA